MLMHAKMANFSAARNLLPSCALKKTRRHLLTFSGSFSSDDRTSVICLLIETALKANCDPKQQKEERLVQENRDFVGSFVNDDQGPCVKELRALPNLSGCRLN